MDVLMSPRDKQSMQGSVADQRIRSVRNTDLYSLVAHAEWVPSDLTLGELVERLNRTTVNYVAVQDLGRVVGIVSRETIGLLFGGRYGFSLYAAEPVTRKLEPDFLAFRRSTPLLEALNASLNREDRSFKTDVVLLDDNGAFLGMIPVHSLARLQSQLLQDHLAELQREKERYRDLVENANDIIFTTDLEGRCLSLNKAGERVTGYSQEEARNISIFQLIAPEYHQMVRNVTHERRGISPRRTYEIEILARDGRRLTLEINSRLIIQDMVPAGVHSVARDITERKLSEARLRHNALHDALTGLPNRTLFFSHLEAAVERNKDHDHFFAVLLLDIDRFKVVNDSLGHLAGDRFLIAVAERLKNCVRQTDTVARFGGDEFTVLLTDISGDVEATQITERLLVALAEPLSIDGHEIFSSASVGIAFPFAKAKPEDLLREADIAMYLAKFSGKARYEIFNPRMHYRATNRLSIETDLRRALERGEFELHYQPIISLDSGGVVEFEALVRWRHPQRGLLSPVEFVPVAEETGVVLQLGLWVLREACTQLKKWQDEGLHDGSLGMSVNISVKQLAQEDFAAHVSEILAVTGINPSRLNLEITESAIAQNAQAAHAMLSSLKDLGVGLSTDDFGTGYSSLSYLHRFPISGLKIDRSFIRNIEANGESAEIVRSIAMLGNSLSLNVIAEGVENAEQVKFLQTLGCQHAQGFFFSKPVPSEEAGTLLTLRGACPAT
jgi:Amt family ammonium transporter